MRSPIRPIPHAIARWISRLRWLRWLDAVVAWASVWAVAVAALGRGSSDAAAIVPLVVVCLGFALRPLRVRWRPITGPVGLVMSRRLRSGDRAWYVRAREANLVLVTARHGIRLVIIRPDLGGEEGITIRRTRVLLVPVDGPGAEQHRGLWLPSP